MSAAESAPAPLETTVGKITTTGPPVAEAGAILSIDLSAIEANWRALARRAMPAECSAVIKADGYGCGIEPVAAMLSKAGCKTFFVADLDEARRVRPIAQEATIYVLNGLYPNSGPTFAELHARPVIGSLVELAEWDAFVGQSNWRGGFALQVDTGMNRLGITADEAAAVATRIKSENHGIALLMSHFACSEQPDHPLNDAQIRLFRDIRVLYRGVPASIANSSGIFLGSAAHCDMVRPGVALYGCNPTPGRGNPMRPVIELRARIVQIRSVAKGNTVGYGGTWTAQRDAKVAILALGYADGYPRAASVGDPKPARRATDRPIGGQGEAIIGGRRCPFAGRVSMDLLAVDVTDLPDGAARRGDYATLIGDEISLDDVAAAAQTIGYEVLTRLGHRYHRQYRVV